MLSIWSHRRGHHSCRWSLLLLLGLLKLFGIAKAITLTEMSTDISPPPVVDTKVFSEIGKEVTLYCRTDFPLVSLSIWWYHLSQDGSQALVFRYPLEDMEKPALEFRSRASLFIRKESVMLTLRNVRPQDSGIYICVQKSVYDSSRTYMILQVTAPKEKHENSVVIYTLVGFLSASLLAWMISFGILCKRGDLQCPRNWGQEI